MVEALWCRFFHWLEGLRLLLNFSEPAMDLNPVKCSAVKCIIADARTMLAPK